MPASEIRSSAPGGAALGQPRHRSFGDNFRHGGRRRFTQPVQVTSPTVRNLTEALEHFLVRARPQVPVFGQQHAVAAKTPAAGARNRSTAT